jgi:pyruvate carboxylase
MLNLSPNNINNFDTKDLSALKRVEQKSSSKKLMRTIYGLFLAIFIITFLPWTQNIRSKGKVTTLRPEQRPQTINTVISGKIEKWFVKDGDIVKKGDTILFISEIKDIKVDKNYYSYVLSKLNDGDELKMNATIKNKSCYKDKKYEKIY